MNVIDAILGRSSTRKYDASRVPSRQVLTDLIEAARWAPSSCNLQPTEFVIVDDQALLHQLAQEASYKFSWAPCVIVFVCDFRFTNERKAGALSAGAAMQNMLLRATELGVSACPIAGFSHDTVIRRILNIPSGYDVTLLMTIGYSPEYGIAKDRLRLPVNQMAHWNGYAGSLPFPHASAALDMWTLAEIVAYRSRIAPVYLYNQHFRLHVFAESVFTTVVDVFERHGGLPVGTVCDLITYDSYFIREFALRYPKTVLHAADVFEYPLEVLCGLYPQIKTHHIGDNYHLPFEDNSFDVITMVHKLEFTPRPDRLLQEAARCLKPGGKLFLTTAHESLTKRLFQYVRRIWRHSIHRVDVNMYVNNPFYKIGPIAYRSSAWLRNHLEVAGLCRDVDGVETVTNSGRIPHRFYWALYKK